MADLFEAQCEKLIDKKINKEINKKEKIMTIIETDDGTTLAESKSTLSNLPSLSSIDNKYQQAIEEVSKPGTLKKWLIVLGLAGGSLFLAATYSAQIISGVTALAVLAVFSVLSFYGIKTILAYDPVIRRKIANHAMTKLLQEARQKKIETLENYRLILRDEMEKIKLLRKKAQSKIKSYEDKISNEEEPKLKDMYYNLKSRLENSLSNIEKILAKAKEQSKEIDIQVTILKEKDEFIRDTKDIITFLENDKDKFLNELLVKEATNAIEKEFNEITSSLENIAGEIEDKGE